MIHNKQFDYNGENLKTYEAWRKAGYQVQKGQKAFIQTQLWTPCKAKQENTETETKEENKQNKNSKMFLKKSSLFTAEQVQPIE